MTGTYKAIFVLFFGYVAAVTCPPKTSFADAIACCKGRNQTLPFPPIPEVQLIRLGRKYELSETWSSIRRRHLGTWSWVDGSSEPKPPLKARVGRNCVFYNHYTHKLEAEECEDKSIIGSICEVKNCKQCLEMKPLLHQVCAWYDNRCYIYLCSAYTWHQARSHCLRRGWEIAILKNSQIKSILGSGEFGCHMFWIGLRRDDWETPIPLDYKSSLIDKSARCAVYNISVAQIKLVPTDCSRRKPYLCTEELGDIPEKSETLLPTTYDTTHLDNGRHTSLIVSMSVVSVIAICILCGSLFYWCKKKRDNSLDQKENHAETGLTTPVTAAGSMDEEVEHLVFKVKRNSSEEVILKKPLLGVGDINGADGNETVKIQRIQEELDETSVLGGSATYKKPGSGDFQDIRQDMGSEQVIISCTNEGIPVIDIDNLEAILTQRDVKNNKIVICAIIGGTRTGKSFLMNYMMRYLRAMETGQESDWTETQHIGKLNGFNWNVKDETMEPSITIWNHPFIIPCGENKIAVLLMDTTAIFEGKCSSKTSSSLVSLSTLISSIQVYNVWNKLQEDNIRNVQDWLQIGLSDVSTKATSFLCKRLIFLIRDWIGGKKFPFGEDGGRDYIETKMKTKEEELDVTSGAKDFIKASFPVVQGFLMPNPGRRICQMNEYDTCVQYMGEWHGLAKAFQRHLSGLFRFMFNDIERQTKIVGTQEVTGEEYFYTLKDVLTKKFSR